MASRSGISETNAGAVVNRLSDDHQIMAYAVKAEFDTDDILVWSGINDLVINSETYTGAGTLLNISDVVDELDLKSSGVSVSLSGMDSTVLSYAISENYQNRYITIFLVFLMGGSNEVAGTLTMFKGRMSAITINDDPSGSTINVNAENRLVDLDRPSNYRYTAESQNWVGGSGDTCFKYIAQLQDLDIVWGMDEAGGSHVTPPKIGPYDNWEKYY